LSEDKSLLNNPVRCNGCKGVINYNTDGISVSGNVYDAGRKSTIIGVPRWPAEEDNGWTKIGKIPIRYVCLKCLLELAYKRSSLTFEEAIILLCKEDNFRLMIQRVMKKTWIITDTMKHNILATIEYAKDRIKSINWKHGTR